MYIHQQTRIISFNIGSRHALSLEAVAEVSYVLQRLVGLGHFTFLLRIFYTVKERTERMNE